MPKELFEIKDFSAGLVNARDARDLEPQMSFKLVNFMANRFGKLKLVGKVKKYPLLNLEMAKKL